MRPIVHRLAGAYRPLAARNRLVEGALQRTDRAPVARRMTLFVLVAALFGRRP